MQKTATAFLLVAFAASAASNAITTTACAAEIFLDRVNSVGAYTTSGATVNASLVTGLTESYGIAVSGSNLFVTNSFGIPGPWTIGEYTTSGATVNAALITLPSIPYGIAVSGSNLFVVQDNGTIGEYTTSGATVNQALITGVNGTARHRGIWIEFVCHDCTRRRRNDWRIHYFGRYGERRAYLAGGV